jgi:hypothetical protein
MPLKNASCQIRMVQAKRGVMQSLMIKTTTTKTTATAGELLVCAII